MPGGEVPMRLILETPLFAAFVVLVIFRLDGLARQARGLPLLPRPRSFCAITNDEAVILTDPDGRPAQSGPKIEP